MVKLRNLYVFVIIFGSLLAVGSAYGVWPPQDKLTASDGGGGDVFGVSVSISGDYAIVGARWADEKGADSGSAYIFAPNDVSILTLLIRRATGERAGDAAGSNPDVSGCPVRWHIE